MLSEPQTYITTAMYLYMCVWSLSVARDLMQVVQQCLETIISSYGNRRSNLSMTTEVQRVAEDVKLSVSGTCCRFSPRAIHLNSYSSKQSNGYATRKARAWVFSITLTSCEEVRNQRVEINALRCFEMMRVSGLISVPDCHRRINTLIKTSYSRPLGQRVLEVPLPDPRKSS